MNALTCVWPETDFWNVFFGIFFRVAVWQDDRDAASLHVNLRLAAPAGWLELNNPKEALVELGQISPESQTCLGVLRLRWEVNAASRNWEAAADVAAILIQLAPNEVQGWLS